MTLYGVFLSGDGVPIATADEDGHLFFDEKDARAYLDGLTEYGFNPQTEDDKLYVGTVWYKPSAKRVTNAPEDYDGFCTHTTEELGGDYRVVDILEEHLQWQTNRYQSGMYFPMTLEKWEELRPRLLPA